MHTRGNGNEYNEYDDNEYLASDSQFVEADGTFGDHISLKNKK